MPADAFGKQLPSWGTNIWGTNMAASPEDAGTTAAVQQYLGELAGVRGDSSADPLVRALLARAVGRLHMLCATLLHRGYPRLTHPPLNLQAEELLSAVVERLLKALEKARPQNVRQFFALANQHIRWELNDLARRLDKNEPCVELMESFAVAPESSGSELSQNARRMLDAIENLPEIEREVFSLVRIQGMTQAEAADVMGVSLKTIQRRLNHGVFLLSETLADLEPGGQSSGEA
jgi:RNA polymerase sigma-70 factor (ECF subfamily)